MIFEKIKNKEQSLEEIKNIALKVLDNDENRNKTLDRKAEILLGFLGIIIPLVIGLFYYFYPKNSFKIDLSNCFNLIINIKFFILSFLILLSFSISAILCILTMVTWTFKNIDLPRIWEREDKGKNVSSILQIKMDLIEHFYDIHKINKNVLDKKANLISSAFFSLIPGIFFILIIFVFLFFI